MKRMSSWLLIFFMILFWVFRVIVVIRSQTQADLGGFISFNCNTEIIILFITIICFILILKRNLLGALIHLVSYIYYFGEYLFLNAIPQITNGQNDIGLLQNVIISVLGILVAVFIFLDVTIDKKTKNDHKDNKTDWFFKGDKFDRNLDDRADKNQYRHY